MPSPALDAAFSEIADFGQRLDTSLVGEAHIASPQKRDLDLYGASILRLVAAPLIAMARLAVLAEDGDPTTIELTRVGKEAVPFEQLKIRSMARGSESVTGLPRTKDRDDTRITRTGRFIRRWSIDELLQLNNIRRGEMSLVGPRPLTNLEFRHYCRLDPDGFEHAYAITRPGLTGLEQINGRTALSQLERIEFAKEYAAEASMALDLHILRKTARVVFSGDGAY